MINTGLILHLLFDQNVPAPLAKRLTGHKVETAADRGWEEISNGELINAVEAAEFDILLTADKNLRYQQNLTNRKLALIILPTNHWATIRENIAAILAAVERAKSGSFEEIIFPNSITR
jgi:predicted nuclease of predicted toxin-antitoxin system